MMKKVLTLIVCIFALYGVASAQKISLKGTWQFNGGIYNGKPDKASKEYTMQRVYTDKDFKAYASQKGYKSEKYEAGTYTLKQDTCFETQTYSSRPSQTKGKTITYTYKIQKGELILSGKLPTGMVVEEHWIRVLPSTKK